MKNSNILLWALIGTLAMPVLAQQEKPKPQIKRVPLQVAPGGLQVRPGIIRRPQLDLTEDQQKQLQEIRQAYSESVRELFQNKDLTLEDRRDQAKDLRDDLNLQIEAVYTPEQKAKLAKYKDEQAKRLEELRKNRPAVRPRIQLDEKQQKAMLKLRQEHAKKMQAARELPQAERAATYRKLSQEYQKAYQDLLTEEQKKQLNARPAVRPNIRILPAPGGIRPVQPPKIIPRQIKPLPKKDN